MGIGASVFMLAAGAIIAFGVHLKAGWLDLNVVGWVLMLAGAVGLIITLTMMNRRRTTTVRSSAGVPVAPMAQPGERMVVDEPAVSQYDRPIQ